MSVLPKAPKTEQLFSPPLTLLLPLLRESLAQEGRFLLPLTGSSMRPTLPATCRVEVLPLPPDPDSLPLGSLIAFVAKGEAEDALIVHRLVARQGRGEQAIWIAHGDGRWVADRPIPVAQILGQVVRAVDAQGRTLWPGPGESRRARWWILRHRGLTWLRPLAGRLVRWRRR